MTEAVRNEQIFYTKDFDGYTHSQNDFVANQELTVQITLSEYRALISDNAVHEHELSKMRDKMYEVQHERDQLKQKVTEMVMEKSAVEDDESEFGD
ncbi:hypothetical protein AB0Y04_01005 [Loigolactobacillus coryniformis]|uniref:hypothetical protein n=1 Tax=Loigolactobacillus coryniformis TaxID=1610 RepID=UPI003F229D4A